MWPVATHVVRYVCTVHVSIGTSGRPAKMAELIKMPFGAWTHGGPRND